jgi:uncharacterized protein YecE (DUF72 family)
VGVAGFANQLSAAANPPAAGAVGARGCRVLAGASSWSARSLVEEGGFYPGRAMKASERLAYYASRLPLAEAATTYRFPPAPELARRWAAAAPRGFTLDLRAWSLLCGAPTWPESLWPDLQGYVRPSRREGAKLYRDRLPPEVVDECWERFRHGISPLAEAGVLGAVVFRYPSWFSPKAAARAELARLAERMPGCRVAVELTNGRWFEGHVCDETLELLEELGFTLVCLAGPWPGQAAPVVAATSQLAFLRFVPPAGVPPYRFSDDELAAWLPAIGELASSSEELHVVMDNCWRSDAVDNAATLLALYGAQTPSLPPR